MKTFLKWVGIIAGALILVGVIGYAIIYFTSNSRVNRVYAIPATEVAVTSDADALARGEHLVNVFGCNGCHAPNFEGAPLMEVPPIAMVYAPNLTTGEGGVLGNYTDAQLARAIRHGIDAEGHPLIIMPSQDFADLSDEDTAAIIAYLRNAPPVDNTEPASSIGPLGRALLVFNQIPLLPAEEIDHAAVGGAGPIEAASAEYGAYLAASCRGCHMPNYAGGTLPGSAPDDVPAANLTPAGELAAWSTEDFINTIRTGVNPNGHQLDAEMPWQAYAGMSDDELTAIFLYLQSLPPVETEW